MSIDFLIEQPEPVALEPSPTEPRELVCLDDFVSRAVGLMLTQYRDRPRMQAVVEAIVAPLQQVEDALCGLYLVNGVDEAPLDLLRKFGELVGAADPGGLTTEEYRSLVRATIVANRSDGTAEDIIAAIKTIAPSAVLDITERFPAGVYIETTTLLPGYAKILVSAARALGVAVFFVEVPTVGALRFDQPLGFDNEALSSCEIL